MTPTVEQLVAALTAVIEKSGYIDLGRLDLDFFEGSELHEVAKEIHAALHSTRETRDDRTTDAEGSASDTQRTG